MQLVSLVTAPVAPPAPSTALDDAVMHLDWAHETAGSATSDPEYLSADELFGASRDAATAAELLTSIQQPLAAQHARDAANAFDSAGTAKLQEEPDVAAGVIASRGADAEDAIHDAFAAIGMDGRGE